MTWKYLLLFNWLPLVLMLVSLDMQKLFSLIVSFIYFCLCFPCLWSHIHIKPLQNKSIRLLPMFSWRNFMISDRSLLFPICSYITFRVSSKAASFIPRGPWFGTMSICFYWTELRWRVLSQHKGCKTDGPAKDTPPCILRMMALMVWSLEWGP